MVLITGLVLVILRLTNVIDLHWAIVLSPWWGNAILILFPFLRIFVNGLINEYKEGLKAIFNKNT